MDQEIKITMEDIVSYSQCKRKAFLNLFCKDNYPHHEYTAIIERNRQINQRNYIKQISQNYQHSLYYNKNLLKSGNEIFVDGTLSYKNMESNFGILKKLNVKSSLGRFSYQPTIFIGTHTIHKEDKLELAFIGYLLGLIQAKKPNKGEIISMNKSSRYVELSNIYKDIACYVNSMQNWITSSSNEVPQIILNKNCSLCKYQLLCKTQAEKDDNLSLLNGISTVKTIQKYERKGIFTVKQLSYLYKSRRHKKRSGKAPVIHKLELQALAIRTSKIFVNELPKIEKKPIELFLDIEGIPDQKYYYLIGVLACDNGKSTCTSYWANTINDEFTIWKELINILTIYKDCPIYHYGNYEFDAIEKLSKRYTTNIESIKMRLVNVNHFIYGRIYFPVRSNSLKEICTYIGFSWQDPSATGLQSLVWRYNWEFTDDENYKINLIRYNSNDCKALEVLVNKLCKIANSADTISEVDFTNQPKKTSTEEGKLVHNQFETILKFAHFDYINKKISLKNSKKITENTNTSKNKPGGQKGHKGYVRKTSTPNKVIYIDHNNNIKCPVHNNIILKITNATSKRTVIDLIFTENGVKKYITQYIYPKKYCKLCKKYYISDELKNTSNKTFGRSYQTFGHSFQSWIIFQRLFLRLPYNVITQVVENQFNESISEGTIVNFIKYFSKYYADTEKYLIESIIASPFVHVDETKINIQGIDEYIWVFTDGKHVIFKIKETRKSTIVNEFLANYNGVLISDFYAGYNAAPCRQQKCWVHLIRDINEDLWKSPFDTEFEVFVIAIRNLILPIFITVEKYGLKRVHFNKFQKEIDRFYREVINNRKYKSELCVKYQKRLINFQDSLFTFLKYDGIPWNNNTAERAIRHLAVQRNISGSFYSNIVPKYLLLLGIMQSCKFQNKSFLKFLLSNETCVDRFKQKKFIRNSVMTKKQDM